MGRILRKIFPVFFQKFQVFESRIFICMKKIIISENQLQKLIEFSQNELKAVKPNDLQLMKIINSYGKKDRNSN